MKIYQDNKYGVRTSPEFEREPDFFIWIGTVLLEIQECSDQNNEEVLTRWGYTREMQN
jgi:hypothetical protein